jgi:solute:Na+ symporter, SSS family
LGVVADNDDCHANLPFVISLENRSMTSLQFTLLDWGILAGYIVVLGVAGYLSSRRTLKNADDYFLASHHAPTWLVAVSVLSTVQSAATFLGVPDNSYRSNYTYLASTIGALIGAWFVGRVLIPRFYAMNAATVYELLEVRFDVTARRAAGTMYLVGRVLASGARLYLAAIAVSMIMFLDVQSQHIVIASLVLLVFGLVFTFMGGLNSVIWSDLVQVILYVGAAIMVLIFLLIKIPAPLPDIIQSLSHAPDGHDKLQLFDWSFNLTSPYSMFAAVTGLVLINIGNSGLDQDTTQRLLACENAKNGTRALYASVWASIPVILIFLMIGSLLHIFYERPDLMSSGGNSMAKTFQGEKVTVFMYFILSEIPPGLRGLVTVGVIAAAAINSGLISMAAVLVNDFYRPWKQRTGDFSEQHFIHAGRITMIILGLALFAMSILCYYWQRYSSLPLLDFVLGVMAFAYSGLLGVYFTAVFTKRGSSMSVIAALAAGFLTILFFQSYIVDGIGLPDFLKTIAFPWQLCAGTIVSIIVCMLGNQPAQTGESKKHA